jgi:hypothetical protein
MPDHDAQTDDAAAEIDYLMRMAAQVLDGSPAATTFLDWIADVGPLVAADCAARIDPRTGPSGDAFRSLGAHIYNAMPVAANRFRPYKLAPPGRNDPCLCGSGRKYKQCCQGLSKALVLSDMNLLRYTRDILPKKRFAELMQVHADPAAVADTARHWTD